MVASPLNKTGHVALKPAPGRINLTKWRRLPNPAPTPIPAFSQPHPMNFTRLTCTRVSLLNFNILTEVY